MLLLNYSKLAENGASDVTKPDKPASVHMHPPKRHSAHVPVHKLGSRYLEGAAELCVLHQTVGMRILATAKCRLIRPLLNDSS